MRESIFSIDGVELRVNVIKLERGFSVTDTENSGRTQDFSMHRDVAGTFYNIISAPVESHRMIFPYGQETLEFKAYVTQGKDSLKRIDGKNLWSGLSVYFVAMAPQRRP